MCEDSRQANGRIHDIEVGQVKTFKWNTSKYSSESTPDQQIGDLTTIKWDKSRHSNENPKDIQVRGHQTIKRRTQDIQVKIRNTCK